MNICFEIKIIDNLIMRKIIKSNNLEKGLIPPGQGRIIKYLVDHQDNDVYQKDLEKEMLLRKSTLSGILDTMEKNELIKRENIGKSNKIVLLPKSIYFSDKVKEKINNFEKEIEKGISSQELVLFMNVLNKIKKNLEDQND